MKIINVLSWGGGTQSTALMILMLDGKIKDNNGNVIKPNYIIFADTKDESEMTYSQIYKVQEYVKKNYDQDIIITSKNKYQLRDSEVIKLVKENKSSGNIYRSAEYADLYQNILLFYQGVLDKTDIVPHWVVNSNGDIGKLMGRQCTVVYKINAILKELRKQEQIDRFNAKKHRINMYIGFTIDEISRVKESPSSYIDNIFPLVEMRMAKYDCIKYIENKLGFTPRSSVCGMCYANDFDRVYDLYKNDPKSWQRILKLDEAMANKPKNHRVHGDVYMFKWQIKIRKRFNEIDMEEERKLRDKYKQISIFDLEQEMACMGGCFL